MRADDGGVPEPAAADEPSAAVLDPRILSTIRALDESGDFFVELVGVFSNSFASILPGLREAIATGDAKETSRAAHSLKSTSNNLGARPLAALCRDLEILGREGRMDRAPEILAAIDAEYARARAALLAESA
jgi:HPt (histidine-containing phosphotransfer) domain-containing protein